MSIHANIIASYICSAWFSDIRISTCLPEEAVTKSHNNMHDYTSEPFHNIPT